MKKLVSKNCLRCGSPKGEDGGNCYAWGTRYGNHFFTYMKPETKEEEQKEADNFFNLLKEQ